MPEQTQAQQLREEIFEKVNSMEIPWFLKLEIKWILKLLNYYKLKNFHKNMDKFEEYLNKLSLNYNEQLIYLVNENLNEQKK